MGEVGSKLTDQCNFPFWVTNLRATVQYDTLATCFNTSEEPLV